MCKQLLTEEAGGPQRHSLGLHQLVLIHGRERAREMVPERQRPLVDIAAEVMADESQRIGISYTGFCLTSLPHKRLPDEQTWEKKGHRVTLLGRARPDESPRQGRDLWRARMAPAPG